MKTLLNIIKQLLGFPPEGPEGELLVTMREPRDCAVAALATAAGVTYDKARRALWHWNLPFGLTSPLLSNPWNLMRAIRALGCDYVAHRDLSGLGRAPGKTIVLVHNPQNFLTALFQQHWVVWLGGDQWHWGESPLPVTKTPKEIQEMVTAGWPLCILEIRE